MNWKDREAEVHELWWEQNIIWNLDEMSSLSVLSNTLPCFILTTFLWYGSIWPLKLFTSYSRKWACYLPTERNMAFVFRPYLHHFGVLSNNICCLSEVEADGLQQNLEMTLKRTNCFKKRDSQVACQVKVMQFYNPSSWFGHHL